MRIGVIGAGGVGLYYGAVLARAGHEVTFLARGASAEAIRERGVAVRSPEESFSARATAVTEPAGLRGAELVLVAVKGYALGDVAGAAALAAAAGAVVLPLLNGVEAADRLIAAGVPAGAVLGGVTYISAARSAPGVVERRSSFQRVIVGELPAGSSARVRAVVEVFGSAGVDATASEDIQVELWRKLAFLAPISAACGLVRGDMAAVRKRPLAGALLQRLVGETAAVARALGVALPAGEEEKVVAQIAALAGPLRPSFLLDLLAGGPNELDLLSGAISRLGAAAGVPTPVHDVAVTVLSVPTG